MSYECFAMRYDCGGYVIVVRSYYDDVTVLLCVCCYELSLSAEVMMFQCVVRCDVVCFVVS